MAHRQTGGYKEEPGVAVAGDHVSVLLFNKCSVYSGAQLACFVLCSATSAALQPTGHHNPSLLLLSRAFSYLPEFAK